MPMRKVPISCRQSAKAASGRNMRRTGKAHTRQRNSRATVRSLLIEALLIDPLLAKFRNIPHLERGNAGEWSQDAPRISVCT
jgi:hypothetical protein